MIPSFTFIGAVVYFWPKLDFFNTSKLTFFFIKTTKLQKILFSCKNVLYNETHGSISRQYVLYLLPFT